VDQEMKRAILIGCERVEEVVSTSQVPERSLVCPEMIGDCIPPISIEFSGGD
jgi:hypothetical protein